MSRTQRLADEVSEVAHRVAHRPLIGQAVHDLLASPRGKARYPELNRQLGNRSITIPIVLGLIYHELANSGQPQPKGKSMPTMHTPTKRTATKSTAKATAKKAPVKATPKKAPVKATAKATKATAKKAATPRTKIEVFDPEGKTNHRCITCGDLKPVSKFYMRPTGMRNAFCRLCGKTARGVITPAEAAARRERELNAGKKAPAKAPAKATAKATKATPTKAAARRTASTRKAAPAKRANLKLVRGARR